MALRDLLNEEENKKKEEGIKVKSSGLQSLIDQASALPEQKNQVEVPSTIKIKETPKIEEIKTEGFFDKVGSFIGKIATSVGNYYSEQDRKRDEMQFKSPTYQIMYGDARLTTDSKTGKKKITSPSLEAYKNAETEEEKLKIIKEAQDKIPAMQFLKSEVGKKITGTMAEATSNIPLKAIASIKAIGDDTYDEAYSALMKKRNDPNNNQFERIMYGLQDSGIQSAIGALLGVAVSIATKNPSAGRAVSMSYFAPISVEEERQSKGGDISLGNVLIDTVGDTIIGGIAESALKTFMKEGAEQTLKSFLTQVSKGFLVEGTTEPSQTFLKFANDYKNSHTEEEKQQVVNDLKEYVKNGGMIDEFLIGGLSGAGITAVSAGAGYISKGGGDIDVEPSLIPSKEGKTDVDVQPTTDSDFEIKGQLNSDFTTIRDEAVELTNEVESNPDNVEVAERLAVVNDQLRDYETAVKNRPVYISSESQEAPLATIETVKYPDGKVAVKISANAENQGMTLDFPQSKLYSSEEEAIIEAKESLISWANESLKSATTVKEIDFLNTIIEETQDFEKIKQETAKKIEEIKKEKTKSLKQKDVVFPTFNQYYKETGGYKAVAQGMDTRGDYINAVIDTLEGKKTDLGKISKERIEEARKMIEAHSLKKEKDLKRLEDAIKKSKGVEKGEEGIESKARESAKDLIRYNVERGESIKSISSGQQVASTDKYRAEIGGYANGKKLGNNKIQVSRVGEENIDPPIIFSLEEIYNEIKEETEKKEPTQKEKVAKEISFKNATEEELKKEKVAADTIEYTEDGGEFIKEGENIVGWIQIDSDNILRAIEIKPEYRGKGIATKVIEEKFGNKNFEARDLTTSGKSLLKSIGTLKDKGEGVFEVIVEEQKKDIIFTGKEVAKEAQELGTDQGFSDYTLNKISKENYKIKTVTISSLLKGDEDLKSYVDAGELREFEGEEFAMNPIVSSSGEVLDGYNRITQTFLDGEKKIDVYYGIKKEIKKPTKKHILPSKKKKVAKPTLLKKISEQQAVSRIVLKKPSMPLLGEVKVENGKMYITDLEISLEIKTGLENGMYKLVGKEFIKTKSNPEDFPDVGKKISGDKIVDIETPLLFNEIKKANSFISKDSTREVLTGITVKFTEDGMRIMSTDSFRLYLKDVPAKISKQEDFIIGNSKKLEKVLPIIGDKASVSINENSVEFNGSNGRIIVNRIKGEFPDVAPIFPSQKIKATFNREEAIKVLKELTPYTDAIKKVVLLREKNKIVFLVDNKRDGIKKEFPLKATIENVNTKAKINNGALIMPIGRDISDKGEAFNSEFLSSNIKAMEEETVNFFYSDYRQAGLITEGSNNIEEEAIEETFKKKEEKDIKTFLSNTQTIYDLRKYFKEEEVEVNFLKQVLMPDGGEAWGKYHNGVISFVNNPIEEAPSHEAVHAFLSLFVSPEDRIAFDKKAVSQEEKRIGKEAVEKEIDKLWNQHGKKYSKNKIRILYGEELLADNFINYVKAKEKKSVFRRFFDNVIYFIKRLVDSKDASRLYEDIVTRKRDFSKSIEEAQLNYNRKAEARSLNSQNIIGKEPILNLKRDVNVRDIYGNKLVIPEGEALTPYIMKGNKFLLKDGTEYVVQKNQYENVKRQSITEEIRVFAPELKDTEEVILSDQVEEKPTKYSDYILPFGDNYKEILITTENAEPKKLKFQSDHWDDKNVLFHLRVDERSYKGEKVTFLEELQSDWAREGRSKGYANENISSIEESIEKNYNVPKDKGNWSFDILIKSGVPSEIAGTWRDVFIEDKNSIPYNPILRNWQIPAIKRALIEAANNDADYFAWTTGEQQKERYKLSRHVESISWEKAFNRNEKEITVKTKEGKIVLVNLSLDTNRIEASNMKELKGKMIEEAFGKGIAEKIYQEEEGTIKEDGLNIGGEWANALYDRQVKNIVEDLTGATVEYIDMGLGEGKEITFYSLEEASKSGGKPLKQEELKVEKEIFKHDLLGKDKYYVVTDILKNGEFKAVEREFYNNMKGRWLEMEKDKNWKDRLKDSEETFSLSFKNVEQPIIKLTPEIKNIIKSEPPLLRQPSGEPVYLAKKKLDYGMLEKVSPIEMPEMVKLARELTGQSPKIRAKMRSKLGFFRPAGEGEIYIRADQFVRGNEKEVAQTLGHEIGHLVDWLPDKTMKRGSLLGRVYTLRKFMGSTFSKEREGKLDLDKIRNKAFKEILSEEGIKYSQFISSMEVRERLKPLIKIRYGEMIDETGAVKNETIKEELTRVTEAWRPYNKEEATPRYLKYRKKSEELYADAISMLFNSPDTLKEMAPTFYTEFFNALDRKPEVKAQYFELMELLSGSTEDIFRARKEDIRKGFTKAEELQASFAKRRENTKKNFFEELRRQVDDINYPITKKQQEAEARGVVFEEAESPRFLLQEESYTDNENFLLIDDIDRNIVKPIEEAGMIIDDLGEYLLLDRIMKDRADIANPFGFNTKNASDQMEFLKESVGEENFYLLRDKATYFHNIVFKSVEEAVKVGSYNSELFETKIKPNKDSYASFQVVDYMQDYMPATIKAQVGTLKEVANPFISTILKTISLNRLNAHQRTKNATVKMLLRDFPEDISKTKKITDGKISRFVPAKDRGSLTVLVDGKLDSYDVDPYIAEAFNHDKNGDMFAVVSLIDKFNNKLFKPLVTTYNLGFAAAFNPIRDFWRNAKIIDSKRGGIFKDEVLVVDLLKAYVQSLPSAVRYSKGEMDAFTRSLVESKAINAPINDYNYDPRDDELGRILERYGLVKKYNPASNKVVETIRKVVLKPVAMVLEGIRFTANTFEIVSKIAGAKIRISEGERGKQLSYNLRNFTGTPNWKVKGKITKTTNAIWVFSNIMKEGIKSDLIVATDPKTRSGYWVKTIKFNILPKLLMLMASAGLLGELLKGFFDDVSEYDKTNYIIIPLGRDETGKTIYIRIPHDETGRLFSAAFWKMANFIKDKGSVKDLQDIFAVGAGQLPSLSPIIEVGANWVQYLSGKNPYDTFRGRNIIDDTTFAAGGLDSFKKMVQWTTNSLGLSKFATYDTSKNTTLQTFMQIAPWFSNVVKISSYGRQEQLKEVSAIVEQKEAQQILKDRKIIEKYVRMAREDGATLFTSTKYRKDLITEALGHLPESKEEKDYADNLITKFKRSLKRGLNDDPRVDAILNTSSNKQKLEILRTIQSDMSEEEFTQFKKELLEDKIVSSELLFNLKYSK